MLDIFNVVFNQYSACEFDFDYDCDGFSNISDNCVYDYNPSQQDLDEDGIGDVCDLMIDGKHSNPYGIVDDHNNLLISKIIEEQKNKGKENKNQNEGQGSNNNNGNN